jgi:tetratricopeptide (TPR) repeat protein
MRRVVFVGNCQAQALTDAFNRFVAPFTGERAFHVPAFRDNDEAHRAALERADVIVELVFDFSRRSDPADLGLTAPVIAVPYVNCQFLWPYAYEAHPRSARSEFSDSGPYPIQLSDAFLNRLMREGVPEEEAAARYLDLDINQKVRLDRRLEMTLALQRQRDEKTGFAVADLMERYFREEPIFLTPYHPGRRIFLHVVERCFARLGVAEHLIARLPRLIRRSLFLQDALPVHPRLAAHFGLVWANEATRYPFWLDGDFTFAEFIGRYLRFDWCEDFARGHYHARQGQNAEAIARLRAGLGAYPEADRAWVLLSHVYTAEGALPEALAAAREAVSRNPRDGEYFAHLGNLLTNAGEVASARVAYERAVALEPEHTPWLRLLAGHWERQGKRAEAGALVATLADKDPLDYELHVQRGHLLAGRGDSAGAVMAFSHALGLAPHIEGVRAARSHTLAALERWEEAIADARAALAETPENRDLRRHLGNLLLASGDAAGAEAIFAEVQAVGSGLTDTRGRLAGTAANLEAVIEPAEASENPSSGNVSEISMPFLQKQSNPRRIAFLGNCQIDTLYLAYRDYVLPFCEDEARYIKVYEKVSQEEKDFLLSSDIVVTQKFDFRQETNYEDFDINAKTYYVPSANGVGIYWPYGGFEHPKHKTYKHYPRISPYDGEYGDLYLNRLIEKNIPPGECVQRYINEDINKAANLDRRLEMALTVIARKDESCGYGLAEFIRDNFRKELLFSSPGHLRRSLSLLLINELFGRLDVEPHLIARLNQLYPGNPHAGNNSLPIHPQVAKHFDLAFVAKDQRYRNWFEGRFTFAEYAARYVRFEFNDPLIEAFLLVEDGKLEAAVTSFEAALKISPESGYAQLSFSHILNAIGRHEEALAMALEAAAILEDDPEELPNALEHLAHRLTRCGALFAAELAARRSLLLAPSRPSLYRLLSTILEHQNRWEESMQVIADLARIDALDHEAPAHLGHMLARRGDAKAATAAFYRSLAINPRQAGTLNALSHTLGGLGRRKEAISAARECLVLRPDDWGTLVHLGGLFSQDGDDLAAIDTYRSALSIRSDSSDKLQPPRDEVERLLAEALARQGQQKHSASERSEATYATQKFGEEVMRTESASDLKQSFASSKIMDKKKMKTLVFCTAYSETEETWERRYGRWISSVQSAHLGAEQILIVDDGSKILPKWNNVEIFQEKISGSIEKIRSTSEVIFYHFDKRLGRNDIFDFPGWHRSFRAAVLYAIENKFDKIIHIESDSHLISERIREYFRNYNDGWSVLWCEKYNFPEMAIQVIAGSSLKNLLDFFSRPYQEMVGKAHENLLPYTEIQKGFIGERYGEKLSFVPKFVDYAAQVRSVKDESYYWWLNNLQIVDGLGYESIITKFEDNQKIHFEKGWSYPESNLRWMIDDESILIIGTQNPGAGLRISMHISPMIHGDIVPRQRAIVALNDRILDSFEFKNEDVLALDIPPEYVTRGDNRLLIIHPDARAPAQLLGKPDGDCRQLALRLLELAIEDASPESYDLRSAA